MSTELDRARADLHRAVLPTAATIRRRGDRRQRRQAITGGIAVVVVAVGIAVGLNSRLGGAPAPPVVSTGPTHSVSPTPLHLPDVYPDPLVMDVDGVGPYRIGISIDTLRAAGLIGSPYTTPECRGTVFADPTGYYAGTLQLRFQNDRLVAIGTAGGLQIRSLVGANAGMSLEQIKSLYGGQGTTTGGGADDRKLTETSGDRVTVFTEAQIRSGAGYFEVGLKSYLQPNPIPVDTPPC